MTSINTIARARSGSRWPAATLAAVGLLALAAACSSSSSNGDGGGAGSGDGGGTLSGTICQYISGPQTAAAATCSAPGMATPGTPNDHCGTASAPQVQSVGTCVTAPAEDAAAGGGDASSGDDASAGDDAAAGDDAGDDSANCGESGYGVTNYGTSASDDDCKYDVSWTSTPICEKGNVYFTVTAKKRAGADGGPSLSDEPPLTGASVDAEVIHSDCVTIAPNSGQTTSEQGGGVYKVGPIVFSKSGKWMVRFHFNACCSDDPEDSPHGHAAFWIDVP